MSNVALWVGGRSYTVNCAAGEEDHIAELGAMIDAKLSGMGAAPGQNETRNLLFAALLLADEVFELKSGGAPQSSPQPASAPQPAPATLPGASSHPDESPYATPDPLPYAAPAFAIDPAQLEDIANRLENLASHLES
jgi:cell division protein ZapA